jgi:transcriptional accessory protein Tex/SPT6
VGVDVHAAASARHIQPMLQFVGGLGPRKLPDVLRALASGDIRSRHTLVEEVFDEQKIVARNAVGAFYFSDPDRTDDLLDRTRIHPEFYDIAVHVRGRRSARDEQTHTYTHSIVHHTTRTTHTQRHKHTQTHTHTTATTTTQLRHAQQPCTHAITRYHYVSRRSARRRWT